MLLVFQLLVRLFFFVIVLMAFLTCFFVMCVCMIYGHVCPFVASLPSVTGLRHPTCTGTTALTACKPVGGGLLTIIGTNFDGNATSCSFMLPMWISNSAFPFCLLNTLFCLL